MTAAWQRKEGQNPKGGLNAKGRASLKAAGQDIKPPVKSGDNPRRASFLARMAGNDGPEYKDGKPTRLLLSLRAWGASSKADAKAKAKAISARNKKLNVQLLPTISSSILKIAIGLLRMLTMVLPILKRITKSTGRTLLICGQYLLMKFKRCVVAIALPLSKPLRC